ncbi:MAG: ImmA/IrrE family metallo-endopeptidase [Betaproteobacteria bacterium]|nr:ImmA/IrrE family metallo-endopeptidase [Betaproteobacteria bacterium]
MIGNRLKKAREAKGWSLRELEAAIGEVVSAQAIGKYERNEMMPSSTVLLALAKTLQVRPDYLLSTQEIELTGVDFRKAPHTGAKEERAVEAVVLDRVERYLQLEELVPNGAATWNAPQNPAFKISRIEDVENAAIQLREQWQLGIEPIPVMAELLEEKGIKVIVVGLGEEVSGSKAFVQRPGFPDVPVIVVNERHNGFRQRFTLAHELGHLVLECTGLSDKEEEKAADWFAGAFFMAKEMMERLLGRNRTSISFGELAELQKLFKVSIACLVVRCSQLGVLSKAAYGRLWGQIRALGLNALGAKEPNSIPPEKPKRMERLSLRAVAEDVLSKAKVAELMHVSVRELDKMMVPVA